MSEMFDQGLATRREVLGDEHVSRSMAAHPLALPLQELLTEYAWGRVWTRSTLPRQTRSLITVAMLTAGRHHEELRMHVQGALRNGCTPEQIAEVVLHSAIYCSVPTALEAMRVVTAAIDTAPMENLSHPDR
jgi:alkylhydroperoxidase/carboxymuconolactone decarboxylase family protein YurZ